MATVRLTSDGLAFDFTHDEVSKIMSAQDVTEQALAVIGAAAAIGGSAVGAIVALVAAGVAANLAIHKNQFQQADKGYGVEMTLPLWAIVLNLWEVQLMKPLPAPPVGQGLQSTRGSVWHTVQPTPSSAFGSWSQLGDAAGAGQIAVGSNADGRLEVFAVDTADRLAWHTAQDAPNGSFGGWSWLRDAKGVGQIAVGSNADGRQEVFAVDTAAGLAWHTVQNAPNGGFGGWSRLFDAAGLAAGPGQITVGSNADGRLEVFALDIAGHVWHTAQIAPNGSFGGWSQLGGAVGVGQITVISTASGSLEVFAVDTAAGMAWTIFQDGPNGNFEGWVAVGDQLGLGHIAVGKNADGRLEVCAVQL